MVTVEPRAKLNSPLEADRTVRLMLMSNVGTALGMVIVIDLLRFGYAILFANGTRVTVTAMGGSSGESRMLLPKIIAAEPSGE
jgi:hypothetical protein